MKKYLKDGGLVGLFSGIVASLCCVTPLVLILFGIGGASFAFSFIGLKPYFLILSLLFLLISFFLHFRKKKCSIKQGIKSPYVITAVVIYIVLSFVILYVVVPLTGSYVFEKKLFFSDKEIDYSTSCLLTIDIEKKSLNAISCASCDASLKYNLEQNDGVYIAKVNLSSHKALVYYDDNILSPSVILKNIPDDFEVKDSSKNCP